LQLWQVLIILPDLRTLHNLFSDKLLEDKLVSFIYSNSSQNQKDKSRRKIKNWNTVLIISTYWEIFQDFYNLQKIILVDPHKRYYSNQQDPRFKTQEVAKQMAEIHKAKLILA
jgi:primosomal protein N'